MKKYIKNPYKQSPTKGKKSSWQKAANGFSIAAEASNVGIVIQMVGSWIPPLLAVGSGVLSTIAFITNPLIYFFRALIRLTRLIGRNCFGITFEEEKHGMHPKQTAADIFSLCLFALSIPMFLGAIITSPVSITLGWVIAIIGLSVVGHVDYAYQAKLSKKNYLKAENNPRASEAEKEKALKEYDNKLTSKRLFIALVIGLTFLLVCGSAAAFAPPALVPILYVTSKIASAYLGLIACGRFLNWLKGKKEAEASTKPLSPSPSAILAPTKSLEASLKVQPLPIKEIAANNYIKPEKILSSSKSSNSTLFSKNTAKYPLDDDKNCESPLARWYC